MISLIPPHMLLWLLLLGFGILIFLGIVVAVAAALFPEKEKWRYLYKKKSCVMTQSEKNCFETLESVIGERFYIFPQMHLSAFVDHKVRGQSWMGAFKHINQKSVDFILCDKVQLSPVLAVELDDRSHEQSERQERDREVERILADAKLPLLRLKTNYSKTEVSMQINKLLGETVTPVSPQETVA